MVYEPEKMLHNSLHYALIVGTRACPGKALPLPRPAALRSLCY